MKNAFFYLLALWMMLPILHSCKEEEGVPETPESAPSITIPDSENRNPLFPEQGGEVSISFHATSDWTVSLMNTRAEGWLTVTPSAGSKGDHRITIRASANEAYDERNATVVLKCGASSSKIVVVQKQKNALTVTSSKYEVDGKGGDIAVEVKANVRFDVEVKEEWIEQRTEMTRGLATSHLNFTVAPNKTGDKREGEIIIKSDGLSETIKVYQGFERFITLTQKEFMLQEEGGDVVIEVKSTQDYRVKLPAEVDWITEAQSRAVSTHTHRYTVAPNETYDSREAEIIFCDVQDEKRADTVSIFQMYKGAILLSHDEYQFDVKGGKLNLKVQTNLDFDIEVSDAWIQQVQPTRGLTEYDLNFIIAENTGGKEREGFLKIKDKNSDKQQVVIIRQSYEDLEREALMALYEATRGAGWKKQDNWGTDKPLSEWHGLKVNGQGKVCYINLPWNNLAGSIPDAFYDLKELTWINFEGNQLTGSLPEKMGEYKEATFLGLGDNLFTGEIPDSFVNLTNLTYFSILRNRLTGEIPAGMEQMPNWEEVIQKFLEPQQPGYGFTDEATVEMIDLGNDLYLHPEGYAIELRYGRNAIIPEREIQEKMKYLYTKFNDEFDFLCLLFNVQNPADLGGYHNAGEFMTINNSGIKGLGFRPENRSKAFGSGGKLKGMLAIFSRQAISVFLHEYAHYYGAIDIGQDNVFADGTPDHSTVHWGISSVHGMLGGFDINSLQRNVDNNPKKYKASCEVSSNFFQPSSISRNSFAPLELYSMGFIPAEEVPDIYIYEGVSVTPTEHPLQNGVFYAEKEKKITVQDIVKRYGERVPNYIDAQKSFRVITIVLTANPVNDREWRLIEQKLLPLEKETSGIDGYPSFKEATGGRGSLQISGLQEALRQ